ncbi:MAG: hypothetical protein LUF68_07140 [Clostridiales bacterium]|nr:hypothetical protein [Clostridiales bacterium]
MKVEDKTTYSRQETEKVPRILEFKDGATGRSFRIHRNIHYSDTWLLTCQDYVNMYDLKTDDIFEAVQRAKEKIRQVFEAQIASMYSFMDNMIVDEEDITTQIKEIFNIQ